MNVKFIVCSLKFFFATKQEMLAGKRELPALLLPNIKLCLKKPTTHNQAKNLFVFVAELEIPSSKMPNEPWYLDDLKEAIGASMVTCLLVNGSELSKELFSLYQDARNQLRFLCTNFEVLLTDTEEEKGVLHILKSFRRCAPFRIANLSQSELVRYGITSKQYEILRDLFADHGLTLGNVGSGLPSMAYNRTTRELV